MNNRYSQLERNRLRWRSRRGMAELDLLLVPFFDEVFADLDESDQEIYVRLLEQDDPDLWEWFSEKAVPEDEELATLVRRILDRVQPA